MSRFGAVLTAIIIAACFSKPGFDRGREDGGTVDALIRDDAGIGSDSGVDAAVCIPSDDFNTAGSACGSWGSAATTESGGGTPSLDRITGTLNLNLNGIYTSAKCTTTQAFNFTAGTSVELVMPADAMSGSTSWFSVILSNNSIVQFSIIKRSTSGFDTELRCGTQTSTRMFVATLPRWIKFTGTDDGIDMVTITVETATDTNATNWATYPESCLITGALAATAKAEIGGIGSGNDQVQFDNFNIKTCPPP